MRLLCLLTSCLTAAHVANDATRQHLDKDNMNLPTELESILSEVVSMQEDDKRLQQNMIAHADAINVLVRNATASTVHSAVTRATTVCKISKLIFGTRDDRVVTDTDSGYTEQEQMNWSQTCWFPAQCFIKPRSALEVAVALKVVTSLGSKFAVRSGGHNPGPGFASIGPEGVLLDLSYMDQIALSSDKSYVSLGPGCTWENVYKELEKSQLTVVGGRVAGVGVGGLILGGGMSHFSNHWGMVADNVKNFEVVLADSRIVNANQHSNSDLFTVLKGGGANFGIVTRCDLYTKPDYKLWYTTKAYSTGNATAVMTAAVTVERNMVEDDKAGFFLTTTPNSLVAGMLYREWVESRPAAFAPFDNITPISVVIPETNGTEQSSALAQAQDQMGKRAIGTVSLLPDAELYVKTLGILQEVVSTAPNISLVHTFQPLGAPSVAKSKSLGGNLLNVQPVSQSWLAVAAFWTDDANNAKGLEQTQTLIKRIKSEAVDAGKLLEFDFMNDSNFAQSPLKHYGDVSISLMKKAAAKYDPNEVFQRLQNNGFLLSNIDRDAVLGESNKPARRSTPLHV